MKVRILSATTVDGVVLPCDCTPDLPESMVKGLVSSGVADADPGAVAYAEKNGVAVPKGLPDYSKQVAAEAKAAKAEV